MGSLIGASVAALVGAAPAESKEVMTRFQGYVRARGAYVEINAPGLYDGAPIPFDKAGKIARKGIMDCQDAARDKRLVVLAIPGQPERRGPPAEVERFFRKMLRAACMARDNAARENKVVAACQRGN